MTNTERYIEIKKIYETAWDEADKNLKEVVKGKKNDFGLVNDETKKSEDYILAKKRYDFAFKMMQEFNKSIPKKIAKEINQLRRKQIGLN